MLRFLGRGSAFCADNNCAFYYDDNRLVLLDCPMSGFQRLRLLVGDDPADSGISGITVLVTHTHSDHVGGIGMLVHYCSYVWNIPVKVIAPCREVADDIRFMLLRLDGCRETAFTVVTADEEDSCFVPVPTEHSPELAGRCFGWCIEADGHRMVFTGDTNTLEPFMKYLTDGVELYTEASAFDSPVHLYIERLRKIIPELKARGVGVYLMHLDDEKKLASAAAELGAQLAPLV